MQMTAEAHEHKGNQEDHEYDAFLEKINQRVAGLIAGGAMPMIGIGSK